MDRAEHDCCLAPHTHSAIQCTAVTSSVCCERSESFGLQRGTASTLRALQSASHCRLPALTSPPVHSAAALSSSPTCQQHTQRTYTCATYARCPPSANTPYTPNGQSSNAATDGDARRQLVPTASLLHWLTASCVALHLTSLHSTSYRPSTSSSRLLSPSRLAARLDLLSLSCPVGHVPRSPLVSARLRPGMAVWRVLSPLVV